MSTDGRSNRLGRLLHSNGVRRLVLCHDVAVADSGPPIRFATLGRLVDQASIICAPLADQTASASVIAKAIEASVQVDARLHPVDLGVLNGVDPDDTSDDLRSMTGAIRAYRSGGGPYPTAACIPGHESLDDTSTRIQAVLTTAGSARCIVLIADQTLLSHARNMVHLGDHLSERTVCWYPMPSNQFVVYDVLPGGFGLAAVIDGDEITATSPTFRS